MNQNSLENIIAASQVYAAHFPGFVKMSKGTLQKLSASPEQRFPSLAADSPSISIHGRLRFFVTAIDDAFV